MYFHILSDQLMRAKKNREFSKHTASLKKVYQTSSSSDKGKSIKIPACQLDTRIPFDYNMKSDYNWRDSPRTLF